ncbi:MAG TPA: alanine racemase, partial [Arenicellales bacterium]|nr:alanine racemase [Arenicellales bacterium]
VMGWPESHAEWVRPGLMLYGASPLKGQSAEELGLRPVMTLESTLIDRREFNRGESVGYGKTWQCPEAMPIGLIECGYGDGYPRVLSQQAEVLVGGHRAKIIGRVSMDMISIDLRGLPEVSAGDPVILWGEGLPIEEIAAAAGTISYELMTKVTTRVMGDRG